MNKITQKLLFILFNIVIIWITFDSTVLIHEWTHGFVAWLNGVKTSPFDIYYGDWTLLQVDEAVDYKSLLDAKRHWVVAFIAISPIVINLILALYCFQLMTKPAIQTKKWWYIFIFWFSAFNLSEFFSYVPIRTFTTHADVFNFNHAMNSSPWIIGLIGGLASVLLIGYFFIKVLPMTYQVLHMTQLWPRLMYLSVSLFIFFFLGGCRGMYHYGPVSEMMGTISLILIPIVFVLCFPSRTWCRGLKL